MSWLPAPLGVRMTSGQRTSPPNIAPIFAAWLITWSIATSRKLIVMISTTGRSPEHRRADARADEALLGDRRVAHAVGAELLAAGRR